MKALKSKSLMSLIYAVLLALPLCAILSRIIYVQSNKNAYQSYSNNYVEKLTQVNSTNLVNEYAEYQVNYSANSGNSATIYVNDTNLYDYIDTNNKTIDSIAFINETYARINLNFTDSTSLRVNNWNEITNSFYITMKSTTFDFTTQLTHANLYLITYQNEKLDNVFEYSVSQFVSENDFGQLNFFQWYDELLLSNNSHNALYIHFANWYLNYAMLISLMQILFLVLMWFVNFARKLLDRGMNYDW